METKSNFKEIAEYEGLYKVSDSGYVLSAPQALNRCGGIFLRGEKILKPTVNQGRAFVLLYKNGKAKRCSIHRLVAKAFIPNPDNKPEVNHIDGNPLNNHVSNLEWATRIENQRHAYATGLNKGVQKNDPIRSKPVIKLTVSGAEIETYPSASEAARQNNVAPSNINHAIKQNTHSNGHYWKYAN